MDEDLRIPPYFTIAADELLWSTSRSSGAGGQHVNRTESKVTLRWNVEASPAPTEAQRARLRKRLGNRINVAGELVVHVEDERSQHRNREIALQRLAGLLRMALHVDPPRVATRPTRSSQQRRLDGKKASGQKKRLRQRGGFDD
jgi:ribosome-associated protein